MTSWEGKACKFACKECKRKGRTRLHDKQSFLDKSPQDAKNSGTYASGFGVTYMYRHANRCVKADDIAGRTALAWWADNQSRKKRKSNKLEGVAGVPSGSVPCTSAARASSSSVIGAMDRHVVRISPEAVSAEDVKRGIVEYVLK